MENSNSTQWMIALVAIVAVVSIVTMTWMGRGTSAAPSGVYAPASSSATAHTVAGQAYYNPDEGYYGGAIELDDGSDQCVNEVIEGKGYKSEKNCVSNGYCWVSSTNGVIDSSDCYNTETGHSVHCQSWATGRWDCREAQDGVQLPRR